jgi:hypothetical protein
MLWNIAWLLNYIPSCAPILLSLFAIALANENAERKVVVPLCGAAVMQLIVIGYIMASKVDQDVAVYRYISGMLTAAAFLALLSALESSEKSEQLLSSNDGLDRLNPVRFIRRLVALVLLAMVLFNVRNILTDLLKVQTSGLINYTPGPWTVEFNKYRVMQNLVPPGEPILVYTDFPFLFDFRRNPIEVGDIPGACSPSPHMPFFKGAEPLERYLDGLGINYVIHSDFNAPGQVISGKYAEYSKPFWIGMLHSPYEVWQAHAPYFLDLMNNLDSIEKDRNAIHESDLTLFCLKERSAAATR